MELKLRSWALPSPHPHSAPGLLHGDCPCSKGLIIFLIQPYHPLSSVAPPDACMPRVGSDLSWLQASDLLFPQPGKLFLSLIPCPILIHPERAQHPCPLLSAASPASGRTSSACCTPLLSPAGWGQQCPALEALGQSRSASSQGPQHCHPRMGHTGPPATHPTGNNVVLVSLAAPPVLAFLAPALARAAATIPFYRERNGRVSR